MSNEATPARAMLDAWRERGADRLDPVRFRFIEALERRAGAYDGEARRMLDGRLSALLAAYGTDLEHAASETTEPDAPEPGRSELGALVESLARRAQERDAAPPALDYFREVWSRISSERQLRQSFEQVPGNAGPLNSSSLVHRSLSLMRDLSPGYLQHFLSYVDALSGVERLNGAAAPARDAPRASGGRKSARGKAS